MSYKGKRDAEGKKGGGQGKKTLVMSFFGQYSRNACLEWTVFTKNHITQLSMYRLVLKWCLEGYVFVSLFCQLALQMEELVNLYVIIRKECLSVKLDTKK